MSDYPPPPPTYEASTNDRKIGPRSTPTDAQYKAIYPSEQQKDPSRSSSTRKPLGRIGGPRPLPHLPPSNRTVRTVKNPETGAGGLKGKMGVQAQSSAEHDLEPAPPPPFAPVDPSVMAYENAVREVARPPCNAQHLPRVSRPLHRRTGLETHRNPPPSSPPSSSGRRAQGGARLAFDPSIAYSSFVEPTTVDPSSFYRWILSLGRDASLVY